MKDVTHSSPINSKKFVAAMSWNIGWLVLISLGIIYDESDSVLLSMVWVAGATQITYIGGQAALDAFVRQAFFRRGQPSQKPAQSIPQIQEKESEEK